VEGDRVVERAIEGRRVGWRAGQSGKSREEPGQREEDATGHRGL